MIKTEYLDTAKIIKDPHILKLFRAVAEHGGVLRFVGGAVRDVLAGKEGFELDLATDLSPDELVEACQDNGLKTVPIGIKYATTGVVINNKILEVSSLRKICNGCKQSSDFEFTDDWNADASKRDLTINAVYADENGNVFDYYNGISDLENGTIRFIGKAEERIKENHIRIMRFFRFYSIFGKGNPDLKSLKACVENRDLLRNVAIEQVRDELFKIFLTPNIVKTLQIIFENDILSYILPVSDKLPVLERLTELVKKHGCSPDSLRRLYILYMPDEMLAENLAMRLHLTKNQKNRLVQWSKIEICPSQIENIKYLRRSIYLYGKDFCLDKTLFLAAQDLVPESALPSLIKTIQQTQLPEFPLKGSDIIGLGIKEYAKIGDILDTLKSNWIKSDFTQSKFDLLQSARILIEA